MQRGRAPGQPAAQHPALLCVTSGTGCREPKWCHYRKPRTDVCCRGQQVQAARPPAVLSTHRGGRSLGVCTNHYTHGRPDKESALGRIRRRKRPHRGGSGVRGRLHEWRVSVITSGWADGLRNMAHTRAQPRQPPNDARSPCATPRQPADSPAQGREEEETARHQAAPGQGTGALCLHSYIVCQHWYQAASASVPHLPAGGCT